MVQAEVLENKEAVDASTVIDVPSNQTCDKCGSTVRAFYAAGKGDVVLYFCGHHIRRFADNLKEQGFSISPEDISYEAGSVASDNVPA
jgi:hypothetical protein